MKMLKSFEYNVTVKNDDLIVCDHRVHGVKIMPGVTFLELIYEILANEGYDRRDYVLYNVVFKRPVSVSDGYNRKVRIKLFETEEHNGEFNIYADSVHLLNDCEQGEWVHNFECNIRAAEALPKDDRIDIDEIKNSAVSAEDMDIVYKHAREYDITHYTFMKSLGTVYYLGQTVCAELHLSEKAQEYLDVFVSHPVYLDAATLIAPYYAYLNSESTGMDLTDKRPFIPIWINEIRALKDLGKKCYIIVKVSDINIHSDVMYTDFYVYTESGELALSFKRFAYKKIRSNELIISLENDETDPVQENAGKAETTVNRPEYSGEDITERLKNILLTVAEGRIKNVNTMETFYDMGLDSGDLLQFVKILERSIGHTLYPTLLFEYQTISELAAYLDENFEIESEVSTVSNDTATDTAVRTELIFFTSAEKELKSLRVKKRFSNTFVCRRTEKGICFGRLEADRLFAAASDCSLDVSGSIDVKDTSDAIYILLPVSECDGQDVIRLLYDISMYILDKKLLNNIRLVFVSADRDKNSSPYKRAIGGFIRSLHKEYPSISGCYIRLDGDSVDMVKVSELLAESDLESLTGYHETILKNSSRYAVISKPVSFSESAISVPSGKYCLITGGMGKLGIITARHMIEKYGMKVVLIGRRSEYDSEVTKILADFSSGDIRYYSADIADLKQVEELRRKLDSDRISVSILIHCAGINHEAFINRKDMADINHVIKVKTEGCNNLDKCFGNAELEHFVLYSSISGVTGNAGQTDYAYANAYLTAFAQERNKMVKAGTRRGRTVSIEWPLWRNGGMTMKQENLELLKKKHGLDLLDNDEGMRLLDFALASEFDNITVFKCSSESAVNNIDSLPEMTYNDNETDISDNDIAIIGIDIRTPGADNADEFWEKLKNGEDCTEEIPMDRWDSNKYIAEGIYCTRGGFINKYDAFDADFFKISDDEAVFMDPQERLFLQSVWHAVEDAGYTRESLKGKNVSVAVGVMYNHYQLYSRLNSGIYDVGAGGAAFSAIANRASYIMDFHGQSFAVDTACSSTMTALKSSIDSILLGETDIAVVGGVNLTIHPSKYELLCRAGFLSHDGRCRCFGKGGDGYVPGEGVGAFVIKPLAEAKKNGDHVYGIIKGISAGHAGKTNGYSIPNPKEEAEVMDKAIRKSGVTPEQITYVEAQSSGTELGDVIEFSSLGKVFSSADKKGFCTVGSVKANIGHLEAASGVASLVKVLMQMKNKQIAPSVYCEPINPMLNVKNSPFVVSDKLSDWNSTASHRTALINTFGASGSNVSLVVEEAEENMYSAIDDVIPIFVLSARREDVLRLYADSVLSFVCGNVDETNLGSFLYTYQLGRELMEQKLIFIAHTADELREKLGAFISNCADGLSCSEAEEYSDYIEEIKNGRTDLLKGFYCGKRIGRMSVPVYPFRETRYFPERLKGEKNICDMYNEKENDVMMQLLESVYSGEIEDDAAYALLEEL
ncbi:SDR family NAD(P)-dependent oxidoreductase [uncultured Ruminococcus sp.]|uniref:SDR family NAD(P)-dependent oxidoreductase n=1 Tax=uncultured Ruminococcus sp. TaxID=165186 RepID=UPI0026293BAF|nr:SDR family NAD(P)-dependent oxidoreductase [uncultured Ruminococcus sp.]